MTHPQYTQQALSRYTLPHLKRIASELGVTLTLDKKAADTWINAIITHQSAQLEKVTDTTEVKAKAENGTDTKLDTKTEVNELTTVEISSFDYEIYAASKLIASITHDDHHLTQRWVVTINNKQVYRAATQMLCHRYICIHYKDGTLPVQEQVKPTEELTILEISYFDQEAHVGDRLIASISYDHADFTNQSWIVIVNGVEVHRADTPALCQSYIKQQYKNGTLPVQEQEATPCTTENLIMAHIFNECQNYGFEILDDGIYTNNAEDGKLHKLGQVGCTNGNWWVKRGSSGQQQYSNSVFDAVRTLSMLEVLPTAVTKPTFYDEFAYRQLEQLTPNELQQLFENADCRELVAV